MQITVQYTAQLKSAAGIATQSIEVADDAGIEDIVRCAAEQGSPALRGLLIRDDGTVQPTLLLFVGDECVSRDASVTLRDGQTLTIMSPISGG